MPKWLKSPLLWLAVAGLVVLIVVLTLLPGGSKAKKALQGTLKDQKKALEDLKGVDRSLEEAQRKEREEAREYLRQVEARRTRGEEAARLERERREAELANKDPDELADEFRDRFGFD